MVAEVPGQKRIALTRSGRTAGTGTVAKPTATPANNNARRPTDNPTRKSP